MVIGQMGNRSAKEISHSILSLFILNHMNVLSFQNFSNYCEYKSYNTSLYVYGGNNSE